MNDRTRLPLPQGYEPHEIPPDYTGKLWIEGQMHAYSDAENAALREQVRVLREALVGVYRLVGQGGSAYAINFRTWPVISAALEATK